MTNPIQSNGVYCTVWEFVAFQGESLYRGNKQVTTFCLLRSMAAHVYRLFAVSFNVMKNNVDKQEKL